jgi:type IV secretory pathway VirB9-like protein
MAVIWPSKESRVMSRKNVIKAVRYILFQLYSLNNTSSLVSGVRFQASEKSEKENIIEPALKAAAESLSRRLGFQRS